jgi:signal transduction histidine kinase
MVAALVARDASLRAASEKVVQAERLAAIGRMAAHVAHEVRNPLSSIGLNVEMLEEEMRGAGAETRDLLGAIHREIEHLRGVTEEYLRVARPASPRLEPESVADVVRATAQFYGPELEKAGVALQVAVAEALPLVALDEAQFRQVLLNLLKNAREAVGAGGHVRLGAEARDGGVVVRVADDGPGMGESDRARVFDLFYTTKQHGSGLGLPLSQQIVVAHGGVIRCESSPGKGAVFEIWLPAYAGEARREPTLAASPTPSPRGSG